MCIRDRLEQMVTSIIEAHMPNLSNNIKRKLFENSGPLASFSAKIDIAYSLGFIPSNEKRTLHAIRLIRNIFAHSGEPEINFDYESLQPFLAKLPNPKIKTSSNLDWF